MKFVLNLLLSLELPWMAEFEILIFVLNWCSREHIPSKFIGIFLSNFIHIHSLLFVTHKDKKYAGAGANYKMESDRIHMHEIIDDRVYTVHRAVWVYPHKRNMMDGTCWNECVSICIRQCEYGMRVCVCVLA